MPHEEHSPPLVDIHAAGGFSWLIYRRRGVDIFESCMKGQTKKPLVHLVATGIECHLQVKPVKSYEIFFFLYDVTCFTQLLHSIPVTVKCNKLKKDGNGTTPENVYTWLQKESNATFK